MCYHNKLQISENNQYNIENDIINNCIFKDFNTEYKTIVQMINEQQIEMFPKIYYIDSSFQEKDIIKKDGGKWDNKKRKWYYDGDKIFKKARIQRISYVVNQQTLPTCE